MTKIPFNKPHIAGKELYYIAQAVAQGNVSTDGRFTRRCSRFLEERLGVEKVLMTTSCTSALEIAAMLCGFEEGDEVILPSFTFVSTASAFVRAGARPVFVDIRPDTLNLDESLVDEAITPRTRAIVPVHYAGVACEMDPLLDLARDRGIRVVEDAAQALGSGYRGRPLGALGDLGTLSFHETKNVICGEGGALAVHDPELVERAEILRDKGTNRQRFFRGEVDKYTWVDLGSSYAPSEIVCAFLAAQLEELEELMRCRRGLWERYREGLAEPGSSGRLRLPVVPGHCEQNHHLFHVLTRTPEERGELIDHLRRREIHAVFHYVPLHDSPMGRRLCPDPPRLPVTEELSARLLRLPLYYDLSAAEQDRVIEGVLEFFRPG